MIHFYHNDQEINPEVLFQEYKRESLHELSFTDWFMHKNDLGLFHYVDDSILSFPDYICEKANRRRKELEEQILYDYFKSFPTLKKQQKRRKKKQYMTSEDFVKIMEATSSMDEELKKIADDSMQRKYYKRYLSQKEKSARLRCMEILDDFLQEQELLLLRKLDLSYIYQQNQESLHLTLQKEIDRALCQDALYCKVKKTVRRGPRYYHKYHWQELRKETLERFFQQVSRDKEEAILEWIEEEDSLDRYMVRFLFENDNLLSELEDREQKESLFLNEYHSQMEEYKTNLLEWIDLSAGHILACLMKNENYQDFAKEFYEKKREELDFHYIEQEEWRRILEEQERKERMIRQNILSVIPKSYPDFYPLARRMKRHFILHLGPTNSGKTYSAMQALKKAGSGAYFAPLRLLAYEQFENMNKDGCVCDLITGEEKTMVAFSSYQSATIEMADLSRHYVRAVIDEAQMIADSDRGGAWTAAILGLACEEIHICAAAHAKDILLHLIEECNDSYEIIWHKRDTPLLMQARPFYFPSSVEAGDALIVFSKRNVHAVASELQRKGRKCSIIYGNLPYDVRQEEARKFHEGKTEVVVATDAIGMGMNLPIRRIVFLEESKFDGKEMRYLRADEIQQIAGRAGRKGMFEEGYVAAYTNQKRFAKAIHAKIEPLYKAVITFPESLIGIPAKLSETMERWDEISTDSFYEKANLKEQKQLCLELEAYTQEKELIYRFITVPFDPTDLDLKRIWLQFFLDEMKGKEANYRRYLPDIYDKTDAAYMNILEHDYRICDLLYSYMDKFHRNEDFSDIISTKKRISEQIMKILAKQKLISRKCKVCGRILPWNYSYAICEKCHFERR